MLYPQNGDRIVAIDSVTSLHRMYIALLGTGDVTLARTCRLIRPRIDEMH